MIIHAQMLGFCCSVLCQVVYHFITHKPTVGWDPLEFYVFLQTFQLFNLLKPTSYLMHHQVEH